MHFSFPGNARNSLPFPLPCHQEGDQQTSQFEGGKSSSDSTLLPSERMYHGPGGIIHWHSKEAPLQERSSSAVPLPQVPPQSPRASTSRGETIEWLLRFLGYSWRVAKSLAKSKWNSTIVNYQYKWNKFRQWCCNTGHAVSWPTSQKLADFFLYLHQSCHLSVSAIKGYKAMLSNVFSLKGLNMSDDPLLKNLSRSFEIQVPKRVEDHHHGIKIWFWRLLCWYLLNHWEPNHLEISYRRLFSSLHYCLLRELANYRPGLTG